MIYIYIFFYFLTTTPLRNMHILVITLQLLLLSLEMSKYETLHVSYQDDFVVFGGWTVTVYEISV